MSRLSDEWNWYSEQYRCEGDVLICWPSRDMEIMDLRCAGETGREFMWRRLPEPPSGYLKRKPSMESKRTPEWRLEKRKAYFTHDRIRGEGGHLYYFAPEGRALPPYKTQITVSAILDIAADGTLAGVELIDPRMPPPPGQPE